MSIETITATRYKLRCEAKKRDGKVCNYTWESDSIPDRCSLCKSPTWNGSKKARTLLTHNGKSLSVTEWAEELGIKRITIYARIRRGWEIDEILDPGSFMAGRKPKGEK